MTNPIAMPKVPHEITLLAFGRDTETERWMLIDIIETSRHFASHHMRRFYRDKEVLKVEACAPGAYQSGPFFARTIVRD